MRPVRRSKRRAAVARGAPAQVARPGSSATGASLMSNRPDAATLEGMPQYLLSPQASSERVRRRVCLLQGTLEPFASPNDDIVVPLRRPRDLVAHQRAELRARARASALLCRSALDCSRGPRSPDPMSLRPRASSSPPRAAACSSPSVMTCGWRCRDRLSKVQAGDDLDDDDRGEYPVDDQAEGWPPARVGDEVACGAARGP